MAGGRGGTILGRPGHPYTEAFRSAPIAALMPAPDDLGLLLAKVCKAYRSRHEAVLRDVGLYLGQDRALAELWENGPLDQTELANRLFVEPPTMTRTLQRMEAAGLVERQADPGDARRQFVAVTERGRALRGAIEAAWRRAEEETFGSLGPQGRAHLTALFQELVAGEAARRKN